MSSTALDLASVDYVEEEYFISGTARAFINQGAFGNDGKWAIAANPGVEADYTTRILVRRPKNPAKFNGVVMVEWLNVTAGRDGTIDWYMTYPELLREGYAYVGVSAQYVGAAFLKRWETGADARYNTINHPGDSFSYDIFSQAANAVRAPLEAETKPLGNLTKKVRALIAIGNSQSASRLITYTNALQPLDRAYDSVLIHSIGSGAALSQANAASGAPIPPGVPATPDIPVPATAFVRTDGNAPILFLNTETEMVALGAINSVHNQPDSSMFRMWEVAGTAHGDKSLTAVSAGDSMKGGYFNVLDCGQPPVNDGQNGFATRAALHALKEWALYGKPAPKAPRLLVDAATPTSPAKIRRDTLTGNAIGGIRLPQIAVPTSTQSGERPPAAIAANRFCFLFGASDIWNGDSDSHDGQVSFDPSPTPEPVLRSLYRNHGDYMRQVVKATVKAVMGGYLRPADSIEVLKTAAHADIPD